MRSISLCPLLFCLLSCAPDLRPGATPAADAAVSAVRVEGEGFTATLDATSSERWVRLDLDRGLGALTDDGWDIALRRFQVMSNGGVSGSGGVEVARLSDVRFDDVRSAPSGGWIRDAADGDDANPDPDWAFNQGDGWYAYNVMDHTLAPRDVVYVVRTTEGRAVKVQFTGYYDRAGTSGYPALRWAVVAERQ